MNWNYRVVKSRGFGRPYWGIFEVYYDKVGNPTSLTADAVGPTADEDTQAESIEDIRGTLTMMLESLSKPVLNEDLTEAK